MTTVENIQDIQRTIDQLESEGDIPRSIYWRGRLAASQEDWQTAASMYQQAAERDDAYGICELGRCYREGKGVETNSERAHELALRAGEMDNYGGCFDVANDLFEGVGLVQPDYVQAAAWFTRASRCEEATPKNRAIALMWAGNCSCKLEHYDEAMEIYLQASDFVKDDVKFAQTYATCLDKAGFACWYKGRSSRAKDLWEKEQKALYEYSKYDTSFDYYNDPNVDRVTKNIVIANSHIEGLFEGGADIIGGLL